MDIEQWEQIKAHVEAAKSGGARVLSNMSLVAKELDAVKPTPVPTPVPVAATTWTAAYTYNGNDTWTSATPTDNGNRTWSAT